MIDIPEEALEDILYDYSEWLHKHGYIDADYYTEEPKAVPTYIAEIRAKK